MRQGLRFVILAAAVMAFGCWYPGLLVAHAAAQALPQLQAGEGIAVTPAQADAFYQARGLESPAWSEDPELKVLAAALGNDADRIYRYVRNEIDVVPVFGVKAGARGAFIDKAGTPFDQAQLMVELLRSAGITASYQLGTITLNGSQFNSWFGLTNVAAARKLLADGGYPATVSGTTSVTSVTMMHVWVKARIGGTPYLFDPAYKPHGAKAGIDVGAAMGFNATGFWSTAIQGATSATDMNAPRVMNLNRMSVRNNLSVMASTLLGHVTASFPNGSIQDVIGGRSVTPYTGAALRQSSLPYPASLMREFGGDLPYVLRTQVTLSVGTTQLSYALDDIYGRQLAVEINRNPPSPAQGGPALYRLLVGEAPATAWLPGVPGSVIVSVNNPYAAGRSAGAVDGTYMDRVVALKGSQSAGMQIFVAAGRPSSELAAYQERVHSGRSGVVVYQKGCSVNSTCGEGSPQWVEPQQLALRRRMGAAFLSQFWDMTQAVGGVGGGIVLVHDVVGAATTVTLHHADAEAPVASSFLFSMEPAISAISRTGVQTTQTMVRTVAALTSALEGSLAQQAGDSVYPVSAVAQLDWAHDGPSAGNRWYYHATPANWNSWVRGQILSDYGDRDGYRSPVRDIADAYIAAGWSLIIPRSSSLGPGPATRLWCRPWDEFGPWGMIIHHDCEVVGPERAGALIAIHPVTGAIAHISARDGHAGDGFFSKGGGGSADIETNPARVFSIAEDFLDRQFQARAGAHNVDLKSGALTLSPSPDLSVGSGDYPYSLSFQRAWRYQHNPDDDHYDAQDPMLPEAPKPSVARDPVFGGTGWTSNLHHYASVTSDGAKIFGEDDPRAAVQTLAAIRVLLSIGGDGATPLETLQRQVVSAFAAFWWTETIQLNTITIRQGHASRVFTRLHNGSFVQRGSAETAELLGTRTIHAPATASVFGGNTHRWWYQHCVRLTGARREVSIYGNWDGTTCTAPAPSSHWNSEGNTGDMMFARQVFPFGVTVSWDKTQRRLSNNLGRWIQMGADGSVSSSGGAGVHFTVGESSLHGGEPPALAVRDAMGQTWRYVEDGARTSLEVRAPGNPGLAFLQYAFAPGTFGTVQQVRDGLGNATQYQIGGGRVSSVIDPLGNVTRTAHDRFGNVVSVEDPLGRISRTEYDALRRKSREIAPEGNAVAYTYDARSNVLTTRRTAKPGSTLAATTTTATWDPLCNIKLSERNALSQTTSWSINQAMCLVTGMRQPTIGGKVPRTTFAYNSIGRMVQKIDPTGLVTQINYDNAGNPTAVIVNPGPAPNLAITTLFGYDSTGNVTSVTDPRGKIHTGSYDAARRLTQYNAPAGTGVSTTWTYDSDGLITQISRANGATPSVTAYSYWPTGRVRTMTDPDGQVTRYDYDAASRPTFTTDPELRRTLKVYNAASEVVEERRAVGTPIEQAYARFTYTLNGKQASVRDARGNQTAYSYDGFDRPLRTTFPNATFEELAYDALDRVTSKLTRANQTITNSYDVLDRLVTHSVPQPGATPAIVTTTTYDLAGRVLTVSDTTGQGLSYGQDRAKRIISVGQTAPNITGTRTLSYGLDAAGNKTRLTWPDGYSVSYDYDDLNRMNVVRENGTFVLATYVHDPLSRRASLVYGNGTTQAYAWSRAGDLTAHTHTLSGTANTWTLGYSKAHQLVSEAASNAAWGHVASVDETTSYGAANSLNQYVTVTQGAGSAVTLTHDGNGNLTGEGTWAFAYDAENRLRTAMRAGTVATYLYDPAGRRQAKVVNAVVTSFLSDGAEEIGEYTGAGSLMRRYVPGPGTDQPIAMITPAGAGQARSYFHVNRQGSTVAMSNDAGAMAEGPYTYDAYGQGASSAGVPFKYTGRRLDPETGLYYYRARYYSASLGRFLQTDPIGYADQMNLYGYVGNDPVNLTDPSGECPICLGAAIIGAFVIDRVGAGLRSGTIAATVNGVSQGVFVARDPERKFSRGQVVAAFVSGFISGAMKGEGARATVINASVAAASGGAAAVSDGKTAGQVVVTAGAAAVGSVVGDKLPKPSRSTTRRVVSATERGLTQEVGATVADEATSDAVDRFANEVGDAAGRAYDSAEKTVSDFVDWVGGCTLYADCP